MYFQRTCLEKFFWQLNDASMNGMEIDYQHRNGKIETKDILNGKFIIKIAGSISIKNIFHFMKVWILLCSISKFHLLALIFEPRVLVLTLFSDL